MTRPGDPSRRALLTAGLALAACRGNIEPAPAVAGPQALKDAAPFPVGAMVTADRLDDPTFVALLLRHFDQITPGLELKMGRLREDDGIYDFRAADRVIGFAGRHGLRVFGHTLVWHEERHAVFRRLADRPRLFEQAYREHIALLVGRYRGRIVAWDVLNEPLSWNGDEWTGGIWAEALGARYAPIAFEAARAADPGALLFLNDYNLESQPGKRRRFLRYAEALLRDGVPLGGLGTQMHMSIETDPRAIAVSIRELGSLGLPVHVSELDVALKRPRGHVRPLAAAFEAQALRVAAAAEAFAALPEAQRFAFTVWGLRDPETWLRVEGFAKPEYEPELPLLFDDAGRPKPAFWAAVEAWR